MAALAILSVAGVAGAAPSDSDFLIARAAFQSGDRARLDALASGFAGQLFEPYTVYWQLKPRLDGAARDDVLDYLKRWPDTPLADRLRADWLKNVGMRRDWNVFALDYQPAAGEDSELACYAIQFRRQREGDAALNAAKPLWFTGQATPESCDQLFAEMIERGDLTLADRRTRFRLAVESGNPRLAQALAAELPPEARINPREFALVDRDPARAFIKGDFNWRHQGGRDLALYSLERSARNDATAVRGAWEKHRARLPEADRRYGNARIAFHAARQLVPHANDWFREAGNAALDEGQHAWRVRAALRAGSWRDVRAAIDAMPTAVARDPAWRYWKARALAVAGRSEEANALYSTLGQEHNFYGLLAGEAIGRLPASTTGSQSQPPLPKPTAAELASFGARPGVQRALKLARLDLRPESAREWAFVIRGMDDAGLLLAAEYARGEGLYDRAINTADRTVSRHDFSLRYLAPYRDHFAAAARDQAVDPAILLGVARQESRFALDIVSSAGAMGLMQLMPPTARWVAKQLGRTDYVATQISEAAVNTQFGAFYFKYCLDKLERLPALAAAAYNAGPSRAQAWRGAAALEGAIWVETIPFNETRDYVKKVLANTVFYARELDQPYVSLSARLGTIPPRGSTMAAASTIATQAN